MLKRITPLATALLLSLLAVLGTTGTANAASAGFKLCNYGSDYFVSATFPQRGGFSTYTTHPGRCSEVTVSTGESFYLTVQRTNNPASFGTVLDRTYSSGRTLVQTWASFNSFTYGKLPY